MREKHPQAEVPGLDPPQDAVPLALTRDQVCNAIKSFKRGSSPGLSGLRPEHLKAGVKFSSPVNEDMVVTSLVKFCNMVLAGGVPAAVAPFFFGACLHGAAKKGGSIRSIAVGEVLRRLASKAAASQVAEKAAGLCHLAAWGQCERWLQGPGPCSQDHAGPGL